MNRFNLVFLLSGGGKFNYQGTKRWIEDNLDSQGESKLFFFFIKKEYFTASCYTVLTIGTFLAMRATGSQMVVAYCIAYMYRFKNEN